MTRGRPRHQTSRRRMYSARQREVRERRMQAARQDQDWLSRLAAIEVEEGLDFESPTSWGVRLGDRADAA
jgi:hypothetical protein